MQTRNKPIPATGREDDYLCAQIYDFTLKSYPVLAEEVASGLNLSEERVVEVATNYSRLTVFNSGGRNYLVPTDRYSRIK